MKSKANGLTVGSFIFGVIAVIMIVMPYIATLLVHARIVQTGGNEKLGTTAFIITFGFAMMAFGFISWVASIVLIAVNLVCNRDGIKTILGCIGMGLNIVCFLYYAFIICVFVHLSLK